MRIQLESTTRIVNASGIDCRVWEGTTESGIYVHAIIPRIACFKESDQSQFQAELSEQHAPAPEVEMFPARMVI